jgi:CDP-glycerol glycerophosphotransferase (TagB/SpsB family)
VRAMLVFEEMYRPGMLNIAAARALGIPTIGVQHGTINPTHMMYTLPPGQVSGAPIPDYFAAYSEYAQEVMTVYGAYPRERIWVTGSPRFDELVNNPPDRQQARTRLDLPADKQIILVTTQTAAWFSAAVKALFAAARTRNDVIVCVKVHPKANAHSTEFYRSLAQQVGATNVIYFDDRFGDLLAACDVLVSGSSTTVLEATLLGRRTICVNFSGVADRYPYVEDGASVPARSAREMETALDAVLSSETREQLEAARQRFLKRHAGPSATGEAGMVLARNIVELAGTKTARLRSTPLSTVPVADHSSTGIGA